MNLWNPPFWSSVIATVVAGGILALGGFLLKHIFEIDIKFYFLSLINGFGGARKDLTPDDIRAKLDACWPKPKGNDHPTVSVDFRKLEKELRLPKGSVDEHINRVAADNRYRPKFRGPNHATFEYIFN